MYQPRNLSRLSRELSENLEDEFTRIGIFYRIFDRVKTPNSVEAKIKSKNESEGEGYYDGSTKFIRDIIGIRIVLYFPDDIPVVYSILKKIYKKVEETIDETDETNFQPIRLNLICRLPEDNITEFKDVTQSPLLDSTFEIQLRTILSEGWHEVDHDLRYKCPQDWKDSSDLARNFNGILATLETSEYAILRLFDQLSYRHFKSQDIVALMRTKFRLRLKSYTLSENISPLLKNGLLKEFYKVDRTEVVNYLFDCGPIVPLTIDTLIFLVNYRFIKNQELLAQTPQVLIQELEISNVLY